MVDGVAGLTRNPFERCPELDDVCLPNAISSLLSELQSGLRSPRGLSILIGGGGCGKSLAAAAFARRIEATTRTVFLASPTSSVAAIARDALAALDASDFDFAVDEDWVRALHANISRRGLTGPATVIVIDDAHKLSPQTLQDLAQLFGEDDDPLRLHVFLFGRARLLERLQAGADGTIDAYLLQVCRLEPLSVRESVRYLERRIAMSGGELASLFSDEAIDEIVLKSEGRMPALEEIASGALRRARRRASSRVVLEDVMAIAPRAIVEEEAVMAIHQQPLQFRLTDDPVEDDAEAWEDADDDAPVRWGDEEEEDDGTWVASEDGAHDDSAMDWDASDDDLEDDIDEHAFEIPKPRSNAGRNRMFGRAVLSLSACLGLVWAANNLPQSASEKPRGRDSMLFAERLTSRPEQIMRLPSTVEEADADAQVVAWRSQPRRAADEPARREAGRDALASNATKEAAPVAAPQVASAGSARETVVAGNAPDNASGNASGRASESIVGPPAPAPGERAGGQGPDAAVDTNAPQSPAIAKASPKAPAAKTASVRPASTNAATTVASSRGGAPVYTVQLGAFKTRSNAEEMAQRLRGKSPRVLREGGLYRVMSGSFSSKRDAVVHEASLRRAGFTTFVRTATF